MEGGASAAPPGDAQGTSASPPPEAGARGDASRDGAQASSAGDRDADTHGELRDAGTLGPEASGSVGPGDASDASDAPQVVRVPAPLPVDPVTHAVILISVDGLAARFVEAEIDAQRAPTFARLRDEGACTWNARTEARSSVTLPNHLSMMSGRPAGLVPGLPEAAHNFLTDSDPGPEHTVHGANPNLTYVRSVFDEVHDLGGYTALFAGKSKFDVYARSYSAPYAWPDLYETDDGPDKIDQYTMLQPTDGLVAAFLDAAVAGVNLQPNTPNFMMLHIPDTDLKGHGYGWGGPEYLAALEAADGWIGGILDAIDTESTLAGTVVIVTADHGGVDYSHINGPDVPEVARIPFCVWGLPIAPGDLYTRAGGTRTDPLNSYPLDEDVPGANAPIRNGDAANLALRLLGHGPLPGTLHRGFAVETL